MSAFMRNLILLDGGAWLTVFFLMRHFAAVPGHPLYPVIAANIGVITVNVVGMMLTPFFLRAR